MTHRAVYFASAASAALLVAAACNSKPAGSSAGAGGAGTSSGATTLAVGSTTAARPASIPEDTLDHYLCYKLVEPPRVKLPQVALMDQFYDKPQRAAINGAEQLCTPVSKDGGKVKFPAVHLLCYALQQVPVKAPITVSNQFERAEWAPAFSRLVCLPTGKSLTDSLPGDPENPATVDHFKCYTVTGGRPLERTVGLRDQFGEWKKTVLRVSWICNPTLKYVNERPHGRVLHPAAHLACYPLKPDGPTPAPRVRVTIRNQFQPNARLTVLKDPNVLCVPSNKRKVTG
jgi:hypothetical protein